MKFCFPALIWAVFVLYGVQIQADAKPTYNIKHIQIENDADQYCIDLLKHLLSYNTSVSYEYNESGIKLTYGRVAKELYDGHLDIIWSTANKELMSNAAVVKVPLFKGINGYKVLIIRQGQQSMFDTVKQAGDFKELVAGQGVSWPDTKILQNAGIRVMTSTNIESLYKMLGKRRFDFFPRAIHEPWQEINAISNNGLIVEKNLLLTYSMPVYFFVSLENQQLKTVIEQAFDKAIVDGSFDDIYFSSEAFSHARHAIQYVKDRTRIVLNNPELTLDDVPPPESELWFHNICKLNAENGFCLE